MTGNNPYASNQCLNEVPISPFLFSRPHPFSSPLLSSLVFPQGSKHRQLLATLRALEAASLPQQPPSLPGSDEEDEEEVVQRKKKRPKKVLFASTSPEVKKERKKKRQKQGPPSSDSKEGEVERKKCHKGALLGNDFAAEEKRKRKCQKQDPSNPAQPLDNVDQTGISACGTGRGDQLILHMTEVICHH